jgi:hypothetical protein
VGIRPEAKPKQWTHDRRDVPCAIVEPLATWRIAEKMVIRIRARRWPWHQAAVGTEKLWMGRACIRFGSRLHDGVPQGSIGAMVVSAGVCLTEGRCGAQRGSSVCSLTSNFFRKDVIARCTESNSLTVSPSDKRLTQGACNCMAASNACLPLSVRTTSCALR